MQITDDRLQALLARVQKPGRYVGQEWNSVTKDWARAKVRVALAYPDIYEIGMSNLGLAILYDLVNQRDDMVAERVYAPWVDMESVLREEGVPLHSLETRHALGDFDLIGFSLQYELNHTNVLNMLDLAGIPILASERQEELPLVMAGGSCTYNPEPMAEFIDLFAIGEGEEVLLEVMEHLRDWRAAGHSLAGGDRFALLRELTTIPGIYVPSLYDARYGPDGGLVALEPREAGVPAQVRKRIMARLAPPPTRPIVPVMDVVHDRATLEIQRGCSRGCRFCQAGMIYRPVRERPLEETLDAIDTLLENTGYSEVGLSSLSTSDYSEIEALVSGILANHQDNGVIVSLPSLRIDSFSVHLAEMIQSAKRTGFTFAPEAGSQRLRDVINKGVTEEDLLRTTAAAFESGWNRIKLYFMIGLPTETDEDVLEIARLVRAISEQGKTIRRRTVDITVSASTFVPKPHTPFQWVPLASQETVVRRQKLLRDNTRLRGVRLSWAEWDDTWLEAILSRGDRRLSGVIQRAWRSGARFDAWSEHYQPDLWRQAFEAQSLDPVMYILRERTRNEILPWSVVDVGVDPRFLWREYQRALHGQLSPDCREQCHYCGILTAFADAHGAVDVDWECP